MPPTLEWGKEGWTGIGSFGDTSDVFVEVDTLQTTSGTIKHRRPDLVIRNVHDKTITLLEVAVAWEPLILEREDEKRAKYEAPARDIGRRKPTPITQIIVRPLVIGDRGTVTHAKQELLEMGIWKERPSTILSRTVKWRLYSMPTE